MRKKLWKLKKVWEKMFKWLLPLAYSNIV